MIFEKSLLEHAYKQQELVEKRRLKLRKAEREYNSCENQLSFLIAQIKDSGKIKEKEYKLESFIVEGNSCINPTAFLKSFGQKKFNEVAKISVKDAESSIGKNLLEKAKGVLGKKKIPKNIVIKL